MLAPQPDTCPRSDTMKGSEHGVLWQQRRVPKELSSEALWKQLSFPRDLGVASREPLSAAPLQPVSLYGTSH